MQNKQHISQKARHTIDLSKNAELKLLELQLTLRAKGAKRNPSAKRAIIEALIMSDEAQTVLERNILHS